MKKMICIMLLAAMVCTVLPGLAENEQEAAQAFTKTWISGEEQPYILEIWVEEGEVQLSAVCEVSEEEEYSIEFAQCKFDGGTLKCSGGILMHEKNGETEAEDISEETAYGFGATLTADGNRLQWTGSGDAFPDRDFTSLEDDPFAGEWECGDLSLYITRTAAGYEVYISRESDEPEEVSWEYKCGPDITDGALTGTGTKYIDVTSEADDDAAGEILEHMDRDVEIVAYDSEVKYTDGKATFTRDGDALIWNDEEEDAGNGLRFVRAAEEEEEEE